MPVPCEGKDARSEQWERRTLQTAQTALTMWAKDFPNASNTGMLCVTAPTLDIDLLDTEAVDAAVALVQEGFGGGGKILLRYGRRPKIAIPFQTDTPFKKIQAELVAPDGSACCPNKFPHIPQFLLIKRDFEMTRIECEATGA